MDSIEAHKAYLIDSGKLNDIRKKRIKNEVEAMLNDRVNRYIDKEVIQTAEFDALVVRMQSREKVQSHGIASSLRDHQIPEFE